MAGRNTKHPTTFPIVNVDRSPCTKRKESSTEFEGGLVNQVLKKRKILGDGDTGGYEAKGSALEVTPASSPSEDANSIGTRCRNVLDVVSKLLQRKYLAEKSTMSRWRRELDDLRCRSTKKVVTTIAVVGDTGAGKSSLINALLDRGDILPTSGCRACTAVVVEVTDNTRSNKYEADIELLSKQEWSRELRRLKSSITDINGNMKKLKKDARSDAAVAFDKVKAVYGPLRKGTSWEEYTKKNKVTKYLGQPPLSVTAKTPEEFRRKIESYIQSTGREKGGEFWPVIRIVRIRIPDCDVCRDGAVLVDLPGTRDLNVARNKVSENYKRICSMMFVVANIKRAIDDKTANDVMNYCFDDQARMDGQYRHVSFICSQTDQIRSREVTRDRTFSIPGSLHRLEKEIKNKRESIKSLKNQCQSLESAIKHLKRGMREKNELKLKELKFKRTRAKIEVKEKQVKKEQRKLDVACIKVRNEYCKDMIKRNFKGRLLSKSETGEMSDDEENVEDNELSDDEKGCVEEGVVDSVENLPVFCVSSVEYLRMTGKMEYDDLPEVMCKTDDTEIPRLREHVKELSWERQRQELATVILQIRSLVEEILSNLRDVGSIRLQNSRWKAKLVYDEHISTLSSNIQHQELRLEKRFFRTYENQLVPTLEKGVYKAASEAQNTQLRWVSKSTGGIAWNTYRTVCHGEGQFISFTYGEINFNKQLAAPMYSAIAETWDCLFHDSHGKFLKQYTSSVMKVMRKFVSSLREKLIQLRTYDDQVKRCCQGHLKGTDTVLRKFLHDVTALIEAGKKTAVRVLAKEIKNGMLPAYNKCTREGGEGMFERMKEHMARHLRREKWNIFHRARNAMIKELKTLLKKISANVKECTDTLAFNTEKIYRPLWNPSCITKEFVETYLAEALSCRAMVKKLCEEVGIPNIQLTKSNRAAELQFLGNSVS